MESSNSKKTEISLVRWMVNSLVGVVLFSNIFQKVKFSKHNVHLTVFKDFIFLSYVHLVQKLRCVTMLSVMHSYNINTHRMDYFIGHYMRL